MVGSFGCPTCHAQIPIGSRHCPHCGAAFVQNSVNMSVDPGLGGGLSPYGSYGAWGAYRMGTGVLGLIGYGIVILISHMPGTSRHSYTQTTPKQVVGTGLSQAVQQYAQANNGKLPPTTSDANTAGLLQPYIHTSSDAKLARESDWNYSLSGVDVADISNAKQVWFFHSKGPVYYGRYVVGYADGTADTLSSSDLTAKINTPVERYSQQGS